VPCREACLRIPTLHPSDSTVRLTSRVNKSSKENRLGRRPTT
jgi:hypothetical protein